MSASKPNFVKARAATIYKQHCFQKEARKSMKGKPRTCIGKVGGVLGTQSGQKTADNRGSGVRGVVKVIGRGAGGK